MALCRECTPGAGDRRYASEAPQCHRCGDGMVYLGKPVPLPGYWVDFVHSLSLPYRSRSAVLVLLAAVVSTVVVGLASMTASGVSRLTAIPLMYSIFGLFVVLSFLSAWLVNVFEHEIERDERNLIEFKQEKGWALVLANAMVLQLLALLVFGLLQLPFPLGGVAVLAVLYIAPALVLIASVNQSIVDVVSLERIRGLLAFPDGAYSKLAFGSITIGVVLVSIARFLVGGEIPNILILIAGLILIFGLLISLYAYFGRFYFRFKHRFDALTPPPDDNIVDIADFEVRRALAESYIFLKDGDPERAFRLITHAKKKHGDSPAIALRYFEIVSHSDSGFDVYDDAVLVLDLLLQKGNPEQLRQWLKIWRDTDTLQGADLPLAPLPDLARVLAGLGDHDVALDLLSQAGKRDNLGDHRADVFLCVAELLCRYKNDWDQAQRILDYLRKQEPESVANNQFKMIDKAIQLGRDGAQAR